MALVSVKVRASYFGAIVSQLSCLECLGATYTRDERGVARACDRCLGCGMLNLDREAAYAHVHQNRLRKRMMRVRFDGRG